MLSSVKKIVICDDHILFSSGLTELLKKSPNEYDIVSFKDSESCKGHLQKHNADVFICDLNIYNIDVFVLISVLKKELIDTKIIIRTAYYEDLLIQKAEVAGIHAFVKKEAGARGLIAVIEMPIKAPF